MAEPPIDIPRSSWEPPRNRCQDGMKHARAFLGKCPWGLGVGHTWMCPVRWPCRPGKVLQDGTIRESLSHCSPSWESHISWGQATYLGVPADVAVNPVIPWPVGKLCQVHDHADTYLCQGRQRQKLIGILPQVRSSDPAPFCNDSKQKINNSLKK